MADVVELGAGEDVVEDDPAAAARPAELPLVALRAAGDAVVEEDAVVGEERSDLAEIGVVVGDTDVLGRWCTEAGGMK
jgi:hypothetical protein